MPREIDLGHLDLKGLPRPKGDAVSLAMQFQALGIKHVQIPLQFGKMHKALHQKFGKLNEQTRRLNKPR